MGVFGVFVETGFSFRFDVLLSLLFVGGVGVGGKFIMTLLFFIDHDILPLGVVVEEEEEEEEGEGVRLP